MRLAGMIGLLVVLAGCQQDEFISVRRPMPAAGPTAPRIATIELALFADARPQGERALIGRSAEANLGGSYAHVVHTNDDIARVTTQAVQEALEQAGFAVVPVGESANRVVVSGSVTRAWIELRRGWERTATATIAADVEVRGPGGIVHAYLVGHGEWSSVLESPKPTDYENVLQDALQDLAKMAGAFVVQSVSRP